MPPKRTFLFGAPLTSSITLPSNPALSGPSLASNSQLPTWRVLSLNPTASTSKSVPASATNHPLDISFDETFDPELDQTTYAGGDTTWAGDNTVAHDETLDESTGFMSDDSDTFASLAPSQLPPLPALTSLTDLEDLPSLPLPNPSPTISLLCSIFSTSEPRTIQTGTLFNGKPRIMSLHTILLLDPSTPTPFALSIWLSPPSVPATSLSLNERELRATVPRLRRGDVVWMSGIRLAEFDSSVVGRMGGGGGRCVLVHREGEGRGIRWWESEEAGLVGRKVGGLVEWGEQGAGNGGGERAKGGEETMVWPDETQLRVR